MPDDLVNPIKKTFISNKTITKNKTKQNKQTTQCKSKTWFYRYYKVRIHLTNFSYHDVHVLIPFYNKDQIHYFKGKQIIYSNNDSFKERTLEINILVKL